MENHDQGRIISRVANDSLQYRAKCAKLLAMFQCSLTGTLFIFQGQEIGLCNVPQDWSANEYKDVASQNVSTRQRLQLTLQYLEDERKRVRKQKGLSADSPVAIDYKMEGLRAIARDNGRTPMQVSR